jgi:3-hydroxy-D-aspartate aldolase
MAHLRRRHANRRASSKSTSARGAAAFRRARPPLALAQAIAAQPVLRFAGLQAYHGRAQHQRGVDERREAIAPPRRTVQDTRARIEAAGLAVPLVTGAGTGTFALETASGAWGELQAGYLFMDADYAANAHDPAQPAFEHALFIKSQVISVSAAHAVCDAGHKSHAIDSGMPRVHAAVRPRVPLRFANGGDEHGILHPVAGEGRWPVPRPALPALGDTIWLIPGHCDPDGQPARPPDRRARRAGARHGGAHHQG